MTVQIFNTDDFETEHREIARFTDGKGWHDIRNTDFGDWVTDAFPDVTERRLFGIFDGPHTIAVEMIPEGWTTPPESFREYLIGQLIKVQAPSGVDRLGIILPSTGPEPMRIRMPLREVPFPHEEFSYEILAVEELTDSGHVLLTPRIEIPSWAEEFRPDKFDRGVTLDDQGPKLTLSDSNAESGILYREFIHRAIIQHLQSNDDEVVSSAEIEGEVEAPDADVARGIRELIEFGELQYVIETGIAARVVFSESVDEEFRHQHDASDFVWAAYASNGYSERAGTRLFSSKDAAMQYLRRIRGASEFEQIPYLNAVWTTTVYGYGGLGEQTAVVRCERVSGKEQSESEASRPTHSESQSREA